MAGTARGRERTGTTRPERKACMPARPSSSTTRATLVRVPVPARARTRAASLDSAAASLAMGSTGTAPAPVASGRAATAEATSSPPMRRRQSARTQRFQVRWAGRATWHSSAPPTPPGPASGQSGSTRSGEADSTSTASARQILALFPVMTARTVSPGRAWRTKTTRPDGSSAGRATQCPPWAGGPTVRTISSRSWRGRVAFAVMASFRSRRRRRRRPRGPGARRRQPGRRRRRRRCRWGRWRARRGG